mmetsp:Transcript_19999/g.24659  ORF Transcript_19999/g.24659 Transcript_19999/m.24659 type:complete len:81 (+) Transcript_19999:32-274(+)|eukprot:CAMPEP_0114668112 /NCGR_PEP_ID=MMETSP0191-20121206/35738_1 /TAXON_ID=126664 /ORGANISM="Sorites sp." /LENGTH=80 /DNA_ID=CAMNT_0001920441 /DNA_START=29 /DNA_END=271 /DNA_ORIENTATION=+
MLEPSHYGMGFLMGIAGVGAFVGCAMFGPLGGIAYCCGMGGSEACCLAFAGTLSGAVMGSTLAAGTIEGEIHDEQTHKIP